MNTNEFKRKHFIVIEQIAVSQIEELINDNFINFSDKYYKGAEPITEFEIKGITTTKASGEEINVMIQPSNLILIDLNLEDERRRKRLKEIPKAAAKTKSATGSLQTGVKASGKKG